ncbi:hypothetical protein B9M85_01340 [Mycobacteroides abscessus]|nr:hypothetical protein B9M85_01340 [Mycobacteroides abscessus]
MPAWTFPQEPIVSKRCQLSTAATCADTAPPRRCVPACPGASPPVPRHAEGTGGASVENVASPREHQGMSENDMVTEQPANTVDETPLHTVPEPPRLYTMEEAADRLRVSREYLYRLRKSGDLIVVKFGRRVLVESAEIDRVIAAARTAA